MVVSLGRPVTTLLFGVLALLFGGLLTFAAVDVYARPGDLRDLPVCEHDVTDGCRTERGVVLVAARADPGDWLVGKQTWETSGDLVVSVRPQPPAEVSAGSRVTVVFAGANVLWLRLPSGAVLETEEHPRFAGPTRAAVALLVSGIGLSLAGFAVSTKREYRSWTVDAGMPVVRPNPGMIMALLGALAFTGVRAYPRPGPIVYAAIGVAALIGVLVVRYRRSPQGRQRLRAGRLPDHLRRFVAADPVRPKDRNNGHLYLVVRPAQLAYRPVRNPARLAADVERLLAAQGAAEFWPGLGRLDGAADGDGVRLTHGVGTGPAGRPDEGDLLILTVAADGTIGLLCGRGTIPWPPERSPAVTMADPALVLGLTRTVLLLAGESGGPETNVEWTLSLYLDRLWGGPPRPSAPAAYHRTIHASSRMLRERSDAVAGQLAGPVTRRD